MCRMWCVYVALVASVSAHTEPRVTTDVGETVDPQAVTEPRVTTELGEIVGLQDEFIQYLGVPYASVNLMDPFGPANPNTRFDSPYYATKDPVICPQMVKGQPRGNIQCLNLNIYKPINENGSLPVMVYIHGGGFVEEDGNLGSYSPKYLVRHDVMVVTVNYRLGPFGFICPEIEEYINQGYKDQELALEWIKNNIKAFGGDENNVILFGHSAGSLSADYHMSLNKKKNFNKYILQSAVQVSPLLTNQVKGREYLAGVATNIGLDTKDINSKDIINNLSKLNNDLLILATKNDLFRPCTKDFTINAPSDSYLKDTKIIIGNTNKETLLFYKDLKNYTDKIKTEMNVNFDNLPVEEIAKVEKFYLKGDLKSDTVDFATDLYFVYPMERSIRHYLSHGATVYRYVFSYDGNRNFMKIRENIDGQGAAHGDELGYLFGSDIFNQTVTARDRKVLNVLTTHWTNFAKYGDPSHDPDHSVWPKYTENDASFLSIESVPTIQQDYRKDQREFWDPFYKKYGRLHKGFHYGEEIAFKN